MHAQAIIKELKQYADPARAHHSLRFFKTGPGQYGEGDQFLGLTVPQIRTVVRAFWRETDLPTALALLANPYHEIRLAALLILVARYQHRLDQEAIYAAYLAHTRSINNWDLVDLSAPNIVGDYLLARSRQPLYQLAHSANVWERRISILATAAFIRQHDFADTLALSQLLLHDPHDLMHKAVGWMLREVGKRDQSTLITFLDTHAPAMPRTMLHYALEKLPETTRHHYLRLPRLG